MRSGMSLFRKTAVLCLGGILIAVALGCGEKGLSLLPVKGTVSVDGEPAGNVSLIFHGANVVSTATSDAAGGFSVVTDEKQGMPAGSYKVTASWQEPVKFGSGGMGETPDNPDRLGGKYTNLAQSQISVEVSASTSDLPLIELSTK
jgi:hypothetical protein